MTDAIVVYGVWVRGETREQGATLVTLYESQGDANAHYQRWRGVGHRTGAQCWVDEHGLHLHDDGDRQ